MTVSKTKVTDVLALGRPTRDMTVCDMMRERTWYATS